MDRLQTSTIFIFQAWLYFIKFLGILLKCRANAAFFIVWNCANFNI